MNEIWANRLIAGNKTWANVPASRKSGVKAALKARVESSKITAEQYKAITGEEVEIAAHSICVHGDNPSAVEFVKNIRTQLTARGVEIAPIREIV